LKKVKNNKNIILQDPLGYLEFTCLMANCKYVVTDSGGIQEESTSLDIPCFTLRENTERPSTFIENHGTNKLINKISEIELKECKGSMDLWDGRSSIKIYEKLFNIRIDLNKKVDVKFIVPEQKLIKYFYKVAPNIQNVLKEYNCYRFNCLFKLIEKDAKTILNIGTGTNYLEYLLCKENNTFLKLDTVDIIRFKNFVNVEDERINYMICDLYKISTNNKYDVVILSEIMEHLNKSDFNHVLKLIKVITNKYCIITVPFEEKYPLYDQNGTYGHKQSFDIAKVKRIFSNFKYELKMIERKATGFNWLVIILHI